MDTATLGAIAALFALLGISLNLAQSVLRQRWDATAAALKAVQTEKVRLAEETERRRLADEAAAKQREQLELMVKQGDETRLKQQQQIELMAAQAEEVNQALSGLHSLSLQAIGKADQTYREANNANVKIERVTGHLEALRQTGIGQMTDVQATGVDTNSRVRDLQAQPVPSLADQLAAAQLQVVRLTAQVRDEAA